MIPRLVICLFSYESKNNSEYRELLSKFDVQVVEIENENHCKSVLHSTKCNGILIDIPTYIKSSVSIKELMSNVEYIFPTARIRYCKEINEMELTVLSQRSQVSLQDFLENYCAKFNARILRRHKRFALNLNLRLSWEFKDKLKELLRTSANVSESGLFVVDNNNGLFVMDKIKIQIQELSKDHFLHGTVVRKMEWGEKPFHAPGFGIRIDHVDEEILGGFVELLGKH